MEGDTEASNVEHRQVIRTITHGNRLIMLHEGRVIIDVSGEEKKNLTVEDLLQMFSDASGDDFSNDRAILS